MKKRLFRVDLRRLILWMCLFFVLLALANSLFASYQVQRETLLQNTLSVNQVYAQKLAEITDSYIRQSRQALKATATEIETGANDLEAFQDELERTAHITPRFNSLFYCDASGHVLAATPVSDKLKGTKLVSRPSLEALAARKPLISEPALAPSGRWLILMSQPVYGEGGEYSGFVGGTMYLHQPNALQTILGEHFYNNSSYTFVVDRHGLVIYHPDKSRVGTPYQNNPAVQAALHGDHGAMLVTDSKDVKMLAGYASISAAGWAVIVQRPAEAATAGLRSLLWRTLYYSLPIILLSLLGIWWLAELIARPLRELAEVASHIDNRASFNRIRYIKGWYFEAALVRKALLTGFSAVTTHMRRLHRETETDPLTNLVNRRGLESALADLKQDDGPLAVVMFDIDHFKSVNDTHGHAKGDDALKAVASITRETARETDLVARLGGEEFVVLLPDTSLDAAITFAERLRQNIERMIIAETDRITISLGIAHYPLHTDDMDAVLHLADMALYAAKKAGRDCIRVAGSNPVTAVANQT